MKVKKISAVFCAVVMLFSLMISTSAAEADSKVIDLGDGFYMVETMAQYAMTRSGDLVCGSVSGDVYYGTTQIGTATLSAGFDISGSTAVAKIAVLEGQGMNGWTYTNGGTYCGGDRASGTAIFQSSTTMKQLPLSMRCKPDGTLY